MYLNEGRSYVSNSLSDELVNASEQGPRASEKFSIVAAVTVSTIGGLTDSTEPIATFLSRLGQALETSLKQKKSLACSNLVRLLGCLYLAKAVKPDILFDALDAWSTAFTEEHVVTIAGLLRIAGLSLRKADPMAMKNFVIDIHAKAAEHETLTTRAKVMLDLVVDIKNNRMKKKEGVFIPSDANASIASTLPSHTSAWFKSCNVESVAIGGVPWSKIIAREKRGMWWIPTLADSVHAQGQEASTQCEGGGIDKESADIMADSQLLKLASGMKMSTDTRRAVFCAVMGGEDAVDATEKLLRLNLKGQQEREIVRIVVECCLHENAWNPYYALVLKRLCQLAKGHRVTLQFCIWDHIKAIQGMSVRALSIFSKFCARIVALSILSLPATVKTVSFSDQEMSSKEVLMWRVFFRTIFEDVPSDEGVNIVFEKLAEQKNLSQVKRQVRNFLKMKVGPWLAAKSPSGKDDQQLLTRAITRCNTAERILR